MRSVTELADGWLLATLPPTDVLDFDRLERDEQAVGYRSVGWLATCLPAQVHEVLVDHGIIEHPAGFGAASACLWVAEQDWVYRRTFPAPDVGGRVYLHLHGLDTLVDVYLNGEHVAHHENAFLPLRLEISSKIAASNDLVLHFHSPHAFIEGLALPAAWEGKVRPHRLLRKPNNDFTDYLGPKPYFTPIGVYDKVELEVIDHVEIVEVDASVRLAEDHRTGRALLEIAGQGWEPGCVLTCCLRGPSGELVAEQEAAVTLDGEGEHWQAVAELVVEDPALWWPRGHGDQPLYELSVTANVSGVARDVDVRSIGFRRIDMAAPFEFTVNGRPLRLWGAQPAQVQGVTHRWDDALSNHILDLAENCNMNAQRIWGSSDRYDDQYYKEADRRGILIWQEFFHDYGMYPDTEEFRAQCVAEATYQVKRLKHHPSLLMWCGGNECFMGGEYDHPGAEYIGGAIFTEDYRRVCAQLDPDRYYHVNSPWGGPFTNDPREGDTHSYTNTWYVPGADYPVMIAEEIRTSPPSRKSMLRYFEGQDPWPEGYDGKVTPEHRHPWPEIWNERSSTQSWRKVPPVELFYDPTDLDSMIYRFGAAHALYLRSILENNRRGKPPEQADGPRRCMGHFVCRWNDSWPIIYGSMLDYYLEPYQPYYAVKRAFAPVLLSFDVGDFIRLWLVNDTPATVAGVVVAQLFDPATGRFVATLERPVEVAPDESRLVFDLNEFQQFSREYILFAQLIDSSGQVLARTNDYVDIERHLWFPPARLEISAAGDLLQLSTDQFARCVELSGDEDGDEFGWVFEDNYFDLLPGEHKTVRVLGRHQRGVVTARPHYSPHASSVAMGA